MSDDSGIIAFDASYEYRIIDGVVRVIEIESRRFVWSGKPDSENAYRLASARALVGCVVLLEWWHRPAWENLIKITSQGDVLWRSGPLLEVDTYVGLHGVVDAKVRVNSGSGFRYDLDWRTGEVLSRVFVK